jgi:hypothetical protein
VLPDADDLLPFQYNASLGDLASHPGKSEKEKMNAPNLSALLRPSISRLGSPYTDEITRNGLLIQLRVSGKIRTQITKTIYMPQNFKLRHMTVLLRRSK